MHGADARSRSDTEVDSGGIGIEAGGPWLAEVSGHVRALLKTRGQQLAQSEARGALFRVVDGVDELSPQPLQRRLDLGYKIRSAGVTSHRQQSTRPLGPTTLFVRQAQHREHLRFETSRKLVRELGLGLGTTPSAVAGVLPCPSQRLITPAIAQNGSLRGALVDYRKPAVVGGRNRRMHEYPRRTKLLQRSIAVRQTTAEHPDRGPGHQLAMRYHGDRVAGLYQPS